MTLHQARDYQVRAKAETFAQWEAGAKNVAVVLPTGSGKSFIVADVTASVNGAACVVAHRRELVNQLSMALAREGVRHRVIGPDSLRRMCAQMHMAEFGRTYYDPGARVAVAGVDTLIGMDPAKDPWFANVALWVMDECHHVLKDNKWGKACAMFPNARGLGVTATPLRADGKGLGRHADGLFDAMVVGPSMRELINRKYLTEYRVFAPPSDIDLRNVTITDSGEYSPPKLSEARKASHITGDVVKHYLRLARGKLGVTFDCDIESATDTAAAYRTAGVPAEVVSSKTPDTLRADILRRFKRREILQLVNVDLFGEGFDLPAIEVVSMARPTMSYALFCQQFGRSLRLMDGKLHALIIDHVGNVLKHGLPDARRTWTLDRRERGGRGAPKDVIPVRSCLNPQCMSVYERTFKYCPFCGHVPEIADRSAPSRVDGDLIELDPEVLAKLRGEIARIDGDPRYPVGLPSDAHGAIARRHRERQSAQTDLRQAMSLWAGWQQALNRDDSESYRRFYFQFGIDVATAQTLGAPEALELSGRVTSELLRHNVESGEKGWMSLNSKV